MTTNTNLASTLAASLAPAIDILRTLAAARQLNPYGLLGEYGKKAGEALRALEALASTPMSEALAAGDGTLHGAIDYWQGRALKAEAAPVAVGEAVALREALLAVQMDAVRLSREEFCISEPTYIKVEKSLGRYSLTQPAAIRLANVPAMARDDRAAFKTYLAECEEFAIVPDVAGAFNAGWQASAHPPTAQVAERQPLTTKQKSDLFDKACAVTYTVWDDFLAGIEAAEEAHGIPASGEAKSHE